MIKRILLFLLFLSIAKTAGAGEVRVSVVFIHYSVGQHIVAGYCWGGGYRDNIREALDTIRVIVGDDTARVVFRSHSNNNATNPLSDTLGECEHETRFGNFHYDLLLHHNRMKIWNSWGGPYDQYAGILKYFFNVPFKQDSIFWNIFETHYVPGTSGDSLIEQYDLVIIKNPYACWWEMDSAQSDSIKKFYRAVRDSIIDHPEINVALAFGTPLRLGYHVQDSSQAKITYDLASWFANDSFFAHSNTGQYSNIWKWDSFRFLCEMSPDSINRYCLRNVYWAHDEGAHLSRLGMSIAQDSLVSFIRRAAEDILIMRSGGVTRTDIDRKIKAFRDGNATLQEVLDLIEQYNNGG